MSLASLIGRTVLRYPVQIVVLTAIVFAPIVVLAHRVITPANAAQAKVVLRAGWVFAGAGVIALLVLVGALAPVVRAIARGGPPPSQLAMLGAGLGGIARALAPVTIVLLATAMGLLALVVPGALVFLLFVLAPASAATGIADKLADSAAIVRARLAVVAPVLGLTLLAFTAVALVQFLQLPIPLGKKPSAAQLVTFPMFVRTTAIAITCIAPIAALTLAAIAVRGRSR